MDSMITWSPGVTLQSVIRQTIQKAMGFYRGNKSSVANALGITVKTLDKKLEAYADEDQHALEFQEYEARRKQFLLLRARGIDPDQTEKDFFNGKNGFSAKARISAESVDGLSPEQSLPLQKSEEIQSMLPVKSSRDSDKRTSKGNQRANG